MEYFIVWELERAWVQIAINCLSCFPRRALQYKVMGAEKVGDISLTSLQPIEFSGANFSLYIWSVGLVQNFYWET